MAGLEEVTGHLAPLHRRLEVGKVKTREAGRVIEGYVANLNDQLGRAHQTALDARASLVQKGILAADGTPLVEGVEPELEQRLYELQLEYSELQIAAGIWENQHKGIEQALDFLNTAAGDLESIRKLTGRLVMNGESFGRLYGHVGVAQQMGIEAKIVASSFEGLRDLVGRLGHALDDAAEHRSTFATQIRGLTRVRRAGDEVRTAQREVNRGPSVLGFFRNLTTTPSALAVGESR